MGSVVFMIVFFAIILSYPAIAAIVWAAKYKKQMTFDEFERRYHL